MLVVAGRYAFLNAREIQRERLRTLETLLDPGTVRVLEPLVERDDLPEAAFDLIHLRLVLAWLPEPGRALARLIAALAPGGVLVAEEMDFGSVAPDPRMGAEPAELFTRVAAPHDAILAERHDFDAYYGRRVAGDLADAGLGDVACEGRTAMWCGGGAGGDVWRLTLVQLRDEMVAAGRVAADEIDRVIALCDDPDFSALSPVVVAAWGARRVY